MRHCERLRTRVIALGFYTLARLAALTAFVRPATKMKSVSVSQTSPLPERPQRGAHWQRDCGNEAACPSAHSLYSTRARASGRRRKINFCDPDSARQPDGPRSPAAERRPSRATARCSQRSGRTRPTPPFQVTVRLARRRHLSGPSEHGQFVSQFRHGRPSQHRSSTTLPRHLARCCHQASSPRLGSECLDSGDVAPGQNIVVADLDETFRRSIRRTRRPVHDPLRRAGEGGNYFFGIAKLAPFVPKKKQGTECLGAPVRASRSC